MAAMSDPRTMHAPSGFHEDHPLRRRDILDDPIEQFRRWLGDAEAAGVPLPNAMALATADARGRPSVRHVLLRGVDERGFQFFTNLESRKGHQLAENPWAGLVFLWKELDRQVHVCGPVSALGDEESDAYFATRPREAQLGAWASDQSTVITVARRARRAHGGDVRPLPHRGTQAAHWGGYLVSADTVELWQGRRHRLHDRFLYTADAAGTGWRIDRLAP